MKQGFRVMDSDFHLMEPDDLWDRYLAEPWRTQAPRVTKSSAFPLASTTIEVQGQTIPAYRAVPRAAQSNQNLEARTRQRSPHYALAIDRNFDSETHVMAMDIEGVDVGILYATRGRQILACDDLEPAFAAALCRAWNHWARDYCQFNPERMRFAAQIPFQDAALAAEEARYAVRELGAVAVVGVPTPVNGRQVHDAEFTVLWAALEELGVPVGFHPTAVSNLRDDIAQRLIGHPAFNAISHAARFPMESMLLFASLAMGGVLERHPRLHVALLECNCGWLPWWLERLDDQWAKFGPGSDVELSLRPSEYFLRQCWIATDPEEEQLARVIESLGDDHIVISTDYPHLDGIFPLATETFLALPGVSEASKRKILWDNCARLYNLAVPAAV